MYTLPSPAMTEANPYIGCGNDPYNGAAILDWYDAYQMQAAYYAGRASRDAEVEEMQQAMFGTVPLAMYEAKEAEIEALRAEVNKWHRGAIGLAMGRTFEGPSIYPDTTRKEK